jgi:glycosyltransferase involved in cell wall biosynthesis
MRVLIAAIGHYSEKPSGSAKVAFDEACSLVARGAEVWVLAEGSASLPDHEVLLGVHLLRYVPVSVAALSPARRHAHQRAAQSLLKRYLPEVDIVHGHVPLPFTAAMDFYGPSVRSVYTVHSSARMEMAIVWRAASKLRKWIAPAALLLIDRMERDCLRRAQVITALSQYTIELMAQCHGDQVAERINLIPGWVDTGRFVPIADRASARRRLNWPTNIPVLFTLRRLVPRMGLDNLLQAAAALRQEGFQFHLAIGGSGPLEHSLKGLASRLSLLDTVAFMGCVPEEVLPLAYAACDAFVLPTAELECFGLIALEAMSAGRPVLSTPIGAIPEILESCEPAWLARSAEAGDIAELLRKYLSGALPARTPSELHRIVENQYSRERVMDRYLDLVVNAQQMSHSVGM